MDKKLMDKKLIIYLAAPYTHEQLIVMEDRYVVMNKITARLITEQDAVIPHSPISYTHRISHHCDPAFDWYAWDKQYLARCDGMIVVKLDGWEESDGVKIETDFCMENGVPFVHSKPDEILSKCEQLLLFIRKFRNHAQRPVL